MGKKWTTARAGRTGRSRTERPGAKKDDSEGEANRDGVGRGGDGAEWDKTGWSGVGRDGIKMGRNVIKMRRVRWNKEAGKEAGKKAGGSFFSKRKKSERGVIRFFWLILQIEIKRVIRLNCCRSTMAHREVPKEMERAGDETPGRQ